MRRGPVGPAESAAEATKGLIERRQYSRNVNYKAIDSLFESHPDSEDGSRAGTPLRGMDDEKTDEKGDEDDEGESVHMRRYQEGELTASSRRSRENG